MDNFLMMLENLDLSQWVLGSIWGYPILLTFHSLGLGLLVGLLIVIDLRVLGFAKPLPLTELRRLMPWVWVGFTFNALSGVVLFMADARKDFYSNSFRWKMLSILIGLLVAVYLNNKVLREDTTETPALARVLAAASLVSWTGAVVAGRLIAYLSQPA
jgi:uncharacterized membrane protein